jgi:hypothetical protein
MNQHEQYYLFVTSFVLCTAAAATRLLKVTANPVTVRQAVWTSAHAGFAGLAMTLIMRGYNASNPLTILGFSLLAALSGAEVNTLAQNFGAGALRKILETLPRTAEGGANDLDFGPPDVGPTGGSGGGPAPGDLRGGPDGNRGTGP